MYKLKNYLLSMQSHWMINHTTYDAVQETIPQIIKYKSNYGMEDMGKTPVHDVVKKIYPEIYRFPFVSQTLLHFVIKRNRSNEKRYWFCR